MNTTNPIRMTRPLVIAALMGIVACGGESATTESAAPASIIAGSVTAKRVDGGVSISNGTERAVAYAVANPNWLGQLATCADPSPSCLRLQPGGLVTVSLGEIAGWDAQATEAVVYWWQVLPTSGGGYQATQVQRVQLSLKP